MSSFKDLDLLPEIQQALVDIGFEYPTEIQEKAIPVLRNYPVDFIGLAKTGTGKTAAFGLPLLNQIDTSEKHVQGVVIAPTRELVQQITKELESFGKYIKGLKITAVYGGASIVNQMKEVRNDRPQIIVASPGRLIDLAGRKVVKLGQIETVILDEADEMLNMGFQEDIDKILEFTPKDKQTWLFSATMPAFIRRITKTYMTDPIEISINSDQHTNENISHQFVVVRRQDKIEALKRFIDAQPDIYALVFCRTRRDTMQVSERMNREGYAADALHGELSQSQRDAVMARFRSRKNKILFATDVAARGIDIEDITHVIHLELPDTQEYYTHRSGRTARAGKSGVSLILITNRDFRKIRLLERHLGIEIVKVGIPDYDEVVQVRINSWIDQLKNEKVDHKAIEFYNEFSELFEDISKEELLIKLLSRELGTIKSKRFQHIEGSDYTHISERAKSRNNEKNRKARKKEKHRNEPKRESKTGQIKSQKTKTGKYSEMFINIGKMDYVNKGELLKILCQRSGLSSSDMGKIEISKRHSIFEVDSKYAKNISTYFKPFKHKGRQIRINPA